MYIMNFIFKQEHVNILRQITEEDQKKIVESVMKIITKAFPIFNAELTYSIHNGIYTITMPGVAILTDPAKIRLANEVNSLLSRTPFGRLLEITFVRSDWMHGDTVYFPEAMHPSTPNNDFLEAFHLEATRIPERFLCAINHSIMERPAYLTTNPKIHYEFLAINEWLTRNRTDPTTRAPAAITAITEDNALQHEITNFLMDALLNKDLAKYYTPTIEQGTQTSAEDFSSDSSGRRSPSCSSAVFTPLQKTESLSHLQRLLPLFEKYGISNNTKVGAEMLRQAVMQDNSEDILILHEQYGASILNMVDESVNSLRKTALHLSIENGSESAYSTLISLGADLDMQDAEGLTPRDYQASRQANKK